MPKLLYKTGNIRSQGLFILRINKPLALLNEISTNKRFKHLKCTFGDEIGIIRVFRIAGQKLILDIYFLKYPAF